MEELFERYRLSSSYDEMFDPQHELRPHWRALAETLQKMGLEQLQLKQKEIDWRLEDNGVTYNVYNDPEGINRPWKLDPIPLLIEESQWKTVEEGLKQRATLLNRILEDIYGEQTIIKEGIVPMEVIYAHGGFLRQVHGLKTSLSMYAADMARGPDGKMWVINDRTQAPSGMGYAIENRLTMNGAMPDLFDEVSVRRLYDFFERFKAVFHDGNGTNNGEPLNVLLSPGPYNETYFEHAYLSSFLGFVLVQGQDLLVKNGAVWLKSLKGLRRVDTIFRRVDETYCDPLELRSDSHLGVAGLVQAVRKEGVTMANPLGSGVLENLGLNPFMPRLARHFLGEELILPQIATWWCGQEHEKAYVLEHLDRLIIKAIDRTDERHTYIGRKMKKKDLARLRRQICDEPYRYVGQEEVEFATCPTLVKHSIEPRKAVIRAYAIHDNGIYSVMPGALVRVGKENDSLLVSNQRGGGSKDLWILGETGRVPPIHFFKPKNRFDDSFEMIPSLRAENLFWHGRYLLRSILTARMIRTTLKTMTNASRYDQNMNRKTQDILTKALTHVTMTYPGFLNENEPVLPFEEIWSVIADPWRVGSLAQTLTMLGEANASVRNLLPFEAWRIFDRMVREWNGFRKTDVPSSRMMVHTLDNLLMHLMAYKELIEESLFAQQGQILFEIGARIERSQLLISKSRALLTSAFEPVTEYEILESLLGSCESLNAYRAHYRVSFELHNVIEFLLLDIRFPKSLIGEIDALLKILPRLPKFKHETYLSRYEEPIFEAFSQLRLSKIGDLCAMKDNEYIRHELDALLSSLSQKLITASNELTNSYFTHYDE